MSCLEYGCWGEVSVVQEDAGFAGRVGARATRGYGLEQDNLQFQKVVDLQKGGPKTSDS